MSLKVSGHPSNSENDPGDPASTTQSDAQTGAVAPKRRIRSFVLRMGRMTSGQERAFQDLWPRFGVEFQTATLNLDTCFGRSAPRMLEIGFGAGDALLSYAQMYSDWDCLGVEVHRPGVGHLLLEADARRLGNLRVICHDAMEVLAQQLSPASLDAVHIYFPDPWPKKRHHKRRLVQAPLIELLASVLKPGGVLRLATDWEHYAQQMRCLIDTHSSFENLGGAQGHVDRPEERPLTRFERRGHRLGHVVWDLAYRRKYSPLSDGDRAPNAARIHTQ